MYSELKAKGLEARLIAFRESADLVRRTVKERGYVVPSLLDANGDVTGRLYGVFGPPTVYFVDRQGRLLARGVGHARAHRTPAERQLSDAPHHGATMMRPSTVAVTSPRARTAQLIVSAINSRVTPVPFASI